ncbi:MAG: glycoside hydrolase family 3 protein [Gammaproteobacteria bacterium]|nr:glycoside hydrolase family 3 protein [Gammaproteobacteria bacterium]
MTRFLSLIPITTVLVTGCNQTTVTEHQQIPVHKKTGNTVVEEGLIFRDLNKDGVLNPYEDWRLSPEARADDLVARMTLEEKAGQMVHGTLPGLQGFAGFSSVGYDIEALKTPVLERHISTFISRLSMAPADIAVQNNLVQQLAEQGRLGIPVSISTDPRNHFQYVVGASSASNGFTQWPEYIGFGALDNPAITEAFARQTAKEYRAVGFHIALSPQADLATEPRWPRINATFGSDPQKVSQHVAATVTGIQGSNKGLTSDGVLTVVKHWVGYGAAVDGFDAHSYYGRYADVANKQAFAQHIAAFDGAFTAHTGAIMPAYPILQHASVNGEAVPPVAPSFNHMLLNDVLRGTYQFNGVLISDWGVTNDCSDECKAPTRRQGPGEIAMPWGVEDISKYERFVMGIRAGIDQFGGTESVEPLIQAVQQGDLTLDRIDESVKRVLITKFAQGLFDNPYVDVDAVASVVGQPANLQQAHEAQAASQVVLKNNSELLPFNFAIKKVFAPGMSAEAISNTGAVLVDTPEEADLAIIRTTTPSEKLHPLYFFGAMQNEGRLNFVESDEAMKALLSLPEQLPVVLAVFLERPAILTEIAPLSDAIVANFGASDSALLAALSGDITPQGSLPYALPSSMSAVEAQSPALPNDSANPLYPAGFSLPYAK